MGILSNRNANQDGSFRNLSRMIPICLRLIRICLGPIAICLAGNRRGKCF